jgi:hypothetical protein
MNSHARYTLSLRIRVFVAVVSRTLAPAKYFDAKKITFSNCKAELAFSGSNPARTAFFFLRRWVKNDANVPKSMKITDFH